MSFLKVKVAYTNKLYASVRALGTCADAVYISVIYFFLPIVYLFKTDDLRWCLLFIIIIIAIIIVKLFSIISIIKVFDCA